MYVWYKKETKEVFYVGKGTKKRKDELHNRSKYFMNIYNKYECKNKILEGNLTNEESLEKEKEYIAYYWGIGQAQCNFTNGGTGFSEGKLNPVHKRVNSPDYVNPFSLMTFKGKDNPFYGKKHTEETKKKISESRKGKGGQTGKLNPMYGTDRSGKNNPMYGKKGLKHPNSNGYYIKYLDGKEEVLTYKQCEKKFGVAFTRVSKEGGVLHYKVNTKNKKLYEGLEIKRVK